MAKKIRELKILLKGEDKVDLLIIKREIVNCSEKDRKRFKKIASGKIKDTEKLVQIAILICKYYGLSFLSAVGFISDLLYIAEEKTKILISITFLSYIGSIPINFGMKI